MDSSDLFMPHNNGDNGDGGGVHGSGGVHAFEPLFCPHPPHHTHVHALSTLRPAALQGRDLCLCGDDAGGGGTLNQAHARANSLAETVRACAVKSPCDAPLVTWSPPPEGQTTLNLNVRSWHCPNAVVWFSATRAGGYHISCWCPDSWTASGPRWSVLIVLRCCWGSVLRTEVWHCAQSQLGRGSSCACPGILSPVPPDCWGCCWRVSPCWFDCCMSPRWYSEPCGVVCGVCDRVSSFPDSHYDVVYKMNWRKYNLSYTFIKANTT